MKHALLAAVVAGAVLALLPATAGAATVRGVVVARSHGGSLVATRGGRLVQIKGRARIGARVVGQRVVGHARRARIHGVVVAKKGSTIFVASNRHLVAIHTGRRRLAGSGSSSGAAPGTIVTSTVTVNTSGELDEENQTQQGQDSSGTIQVQATVKAVGPGTITLTVNGQDVTVELPAGLTLPDSMVGQTVTITVCVSSSSGDDDSSSDTAGDDGDSGSGSSSGSGSGS
jgi:hypothetical protein